MGDLLAELAYAAGWARSTAPLPTDLSARATAATDHAPTVQGVPLAEVTHWLGHMDGTWATIHDRREAVHEDNQRALVRAWRAVLVHTDVDRLVDAARSVRVPAETAGDDLDDAGRLRLLALAALTALAGEPVWGRLRIAMAGALAHAHAEGQTGGTAAVADATASVSIDYNITFREALAALAQGRFVADADDWLTRTTGSLATDLGRTLAASMARGDGRREMEADVTALLGGDAGPDAVRLVTDLATGRSLTAGMLDVYRRVGATRLSWLSAGDRRVCPRCSQAEIDSPYPVARPPDCPAHPLCRCVLQADEWVPDLASAVIDPYLTEG